MVLSVIRGQHCASSADASLLCNELTQHFLLIPGGTLSLSLMRMRAHTHTHELHVHRVVVNKGFWPAARISFSPLIELLSRALISNNNI